MMPGRFAEILSKNPELAELVVLPDGVGVGSCADVGRGDGERRALEGGQAIPGLRGLARTSRWEGGMVELMKRWRKRVQPVGVDT